MDPSPKPSLDPSSPAPSLARSEVTACEVGSTILSDKVGCDWTILNCKEQLKEVTEVKSPTFWHSGTSEWCMVLSQCRRVWYLSFHLLSSQRHPSVKATVRASLFNIQGKRYNVYPAETVNLSAPASSTKKWLVAGPNLYTIKVDATGLEGDFREFLLIQGEVSIPSVLNESDVSVALYKELRSLAGDLGRLLDSEEMSDVVLRADGKELRAHRAVLSARSPVFAAMLRHDTREARTGSIDIDDVDALTLREVLRFIYTGRAPLMWDVTDSLLVAADKYGVLKLKERCEVQLAQRLTVDNASSTAVIAFRYSCDLLKTSVIHFIKNNLARVLASGGWADVVTNHPDIAVETSRLIGDNSDKEISQ